MARGVGSVPFESLTEIVCGIGRKIETEVKFVVISTSTKFAKKIEEARSEEGGLTVIKFEAGIEVGSWNAIVMIVRDGAMSMAGTDVRSNHLGLDRPLEDGREMFLDAGLVQDPVRGKKVHSTGLLQVRLMVQLLDYQAFDFRLPEMGTFLGNRHPSNLVRLLWMVQLAAILVLTLNSQSRFVMVSCEATRHQLFLPRSRERVRSGDLHPFRRMLCWQKLPQILRPQKSLPFEQLNLLI
jgi:hypothetical protein